MSTALVTGGAGFFGSVLVQHLLDAGWRCVSLDLCASTRNDDRLRAVRGDIRDAALVRRLFQEERFDAVFHCAAILAHAERNHEYLWSCNVEGTRVLAEVAKLHHVGAFVFISSNCLWGRSLGRSVREDDPPCPVEIYGKSKAAAEEVLRVYASSFPVIILRVPTIIDSGRLGLLAILFAFIAEGRKVWVVGGGANRYQFIYAPDLARACLLAVTAKQSGTFHIGSDTVPTLREVFTYVIERAGTGARVASLPRQPTLLLMQLAHVLGLSPLGPYHYRMIASDFVFDTTRAKTVLGWKPTLTNGEMLLRAYEYFRVHRGEIAQAGSDVSAHRKPAAMGVIRLLKWLS